MTVFSVRSGLIRRILHIGILANLALAAAAHGQSLLNIDFCAHLNWSFTNKVGPAAVGLGASDFWNLYSRDDGNGGFLSAGTVSNLKWADGSASPVDLAVSNAPGMWPSGSADPMMQSYLYPLGAGDLAVTLSEIPAGTYDLYFYAHGQPGAENGVIEVNSGGTPYGTKSTTTSAEWNTPEWEEGRQYVHFGNIAVVAGQPIVITVKPGSTGLAVMNGLQLVQKSAGLVCVSAPPDLVGWWPGEGNLDDLAGTNHGALFNGVGSTPAKVGRGLIFDGMDDYGTIAYSATLTPATFSVEAWVKPLGQVEDRDGQDLIFGQPFGYMQMAMRPGAQGVVPRWQFSQDGWAVFPAAVSQSEIPVGEFSHLVGTWDGTRLTLYVNGTNAAEFTPSSMPPLNSGAPFYIGGFQQALGYTGQFFNGVIDELSLYSRALNASEIQALCGAGSAGKCPPAPPSVCSPAPAGLVGWWQGEGNAADAVGGNGGAAQNGLRYSGGKVGQAFAFDGVDDEVLIPGAPSLNVRSFTIETWINPSDVSLQRPVVEWAAPGDWVGPHLWISVAPGGSWAVPGTLYANLRDSSNGDHLLCSAPGLIAANQWSHVALSYDQASGKAELYVNGASAASADLGTFTPKTGVPLHIGRRPADSPDGGWLVSPFFGSIDEVSLYSRALLQAEIQAIHTAGSAGKCASAPPPAATVADWTFEDGTAGTAVTSVLDASGNGHVGSIILGNPTYTPSPPGSQGRGNISLALGSSSGLRPEDSPAFNFADAFTLEVLAIPGSNNDGPWVRFLIGGFNPATGAPFIGLGYRGDTGVAVFGDLTVPVPQDGSSHHLAAVYQRPSLSLYLDGRLAGTYNVDLPFPPAGSPVRVTVGCDYSGGFWFGGLIDRARISNRALQSSEFFIAEAPPVFNDGIPDAWRQQYFGAGFATDPRAGATADPDGDGANNCQEYLAGTDPLSASSVKKVPVFVSTYAGSTPGAQDGFRTEARFNYLPTLTLDGTGRLWLPETRAVGYDLPGEGFHRIRLLDTSGMVSVLSGAEAGLVDGPLAQARFSGPMGVVFDSHRNAFVLDMFNHRIRKIDNNGMVSTFAGSTRGYRDGPALEAQFDLPHGLAIDAQDNLFIADWFNLRIRKITPEGKVSTFSGGARGAQDGPRLQATYDGPVDLVIAPDGTMYVSDWANGRIRKIDTAGNVTTFASGLSYTEMLSLGSDGGVYCYAAGLRQMNKYSPDGALLWSWSTPEGSEDGPIDAARFEGRLTKVIELADGNLLVAEDARIRLVTMGVPPLIQSNPAGGVFTNQIEVILTSPVLGGVIRYTTDGSAPAASSPAYGSPIPLWITAVLKAQVFVNGTPVSDVAVAEFTRAANDTQVPTITLASPAPGGVADERFQLSGSILDNVGVAAARWEWNGQPQGALTLVGGQFSVAGLRLALGENRIRVLATDPTGNEGSAEAVVTWSPARILVVRDPAERMEGQKITVPIMLISEGGVGGVNFVLKYDASYLRALELEWSPAIGSAVNTVNLDVPGEVRGSFALFGNTVPAGTQTVAEIAFHVRSVPSTLVTALDLQLLDVSDPAGNSIPFGNSAQSGAARILVRHIVGDNNANDLLDIGDATVIQRFLTGLEPARDWDRTGNDVNQNASLDGGDVIRVLRAVVGLDPQPQPLQAGVSRTGPARMDFGKRDAAPAGIVVLSPRGVRGQPGEGVTFQVRVQEVTKPVSGASFALDYPTNALRLLSTLSHRTGAQVPGTAVAAWNVTPGQNQYEQQNGHVAFGASSAAPWPANNGVLAEFTFEVQAGQAERYVWPIRVTGLEITTDGYEVLRLPDAETVFIGRDPQRPGLGTTSGNLTAGGFELNLTGEPGVSHVIEATTDFKTWTPIATVSNPGGTISFVDPAGGYLGQRFYRATLQAVVPGN